MTGGEAVAELVAQVGEVAEVVVADGAGQLALDGGDVALAALEEQVDLAPGAIAPVAGAHARLRPAGRSPITLGRRRGPSTPSTNLATE